MDKRNLVLKDTSKCYLWWTQSGEKKNICVSNIKLNLRLKEEWKFVYG